MTRPLHLTSTTHAMAMWTYGILACGGALYLFHIGNMAPIESFFHWPPLAAFWAMVWVLGGLTGLVAAKAAARVQPPGAARRIRAWLFVEGIADYVLLVVLAIWLIAILNEFGVPRAAATVLFGGGYLIGCGHRAWQIHRERPLLAKAAANPEVAEVLADPDEDT